MRRRCRRRIHHKFDKTYFKPRGIPLNTLEEVQLSFEELEVLRLRYIEKLNQSNAAEKMRISQSQYQRDLTAALRKITKALVDGHAISIENEYSTRTKSNWSYHLGNIKRNKKQTLNSPTIRSIV